MSILSKDLLVRNNSGDRGSTAALYAAYTVYTVNTVYAVDTVDTVDTILTAIQCVNSSMYAYIYTVMTTRATAVLIIPQQKSWSQFCKISWKYTF